MEYFKTFVSSKFHRPHGKLLFTTPLWFRFCRPPQRGLSFGLVNFLVPSSGELIRRKDTPTQVTHTLTLYNYLPFNRIRRRWSCGLTIIYIWTLCRRIKPKFWPSLVCLNGKCPDDGLQMIKENKWLSNQSLETRHRQMRE